MEYWIEKVTENINKGFELLLKFVKIFIAVLKAVTNWITNM